MRSWALLLLAGCATVAAPPLEIRPGADPARVTVLARLPEELAPPDGPLEPATGERWLRLVLYDEAARKEGPPILADYDFARGVLRLVPRYGLSPGQAYRAHLELPGREVVSVPYRPSPAPRGEPARVESIFPSADRLPANLLKFYLHFSRPMREGAYVFEHLRLLDDRGRPVHDPWRRVDLWTPDARRLTLWIHPGRVKRGVNLREEFGPVLEPGRAYTLEIGPGVLDAEGRPLGRAFTKRFTAVEEDRSRPAPADWKVEAPGAGTREPLRVAFAEPMDRWLVPRYVKVFDPAGRPVAGETQVEEGELGWRFAPRDRWAPGEYTLKVGDLLEDLAGNTPARLFESDLGAPAGPPPVTERRISVR